ncbi:hypothetical protein L218DRAFT_893092 [Marasmius fiardii PR-910]|nr:hypothetical protein L218DRAFT_893092 [Marasmius fiardii PR-910]
MLKAFSLGSLSSLTTPQSLRKCSLHTAKATRTTSKVLSHSHVRHKGDEGNLRPHFTITTQKMSHGEKMEEIGPLGFQRGHVEANGVEDTKREPPRPDDAQEHASRYLGEEGISWGRQDLIVRQEPSYVGGNFNHRLPIIPLYGGKFWDGEKFLPPQLQQPATDVNSPPHTSSSSDFQFYQNLHVIANTQSVEEAWNAYTTVLNSPPPQNHDGNPKIPFQHLHRLCRLLARRRPKTRIQFLRLLSIMYTLRKTGGKIHPHEWNALMANAGNGWRRARPEEFKLAFNVFHEMSAGLPPGSTFSSSDYPPLDTSQPVQPDIYSYNTLINVAAKTLYRHTVARASTLIRSSEFSPDRITHLSLLTFFSKTRNLPAVRSTLRKMQQQGLDLGLDGVTSCLWAYNLAGRIDIVKLIYRVLKQNSISDPRLRENSIADALRTLGAEGIIITEQMRPNEVTFTEVIQALAYQGDLHAAINVFLDMLSSDNIEVGAPLVRGENGVLCYAKYSPTYAVFRALFLGFSRHGTSDSSSQTWTLDNLHEIYRDFMAFSESIHPSPLLLYWILLSFDKTSGHDVDVIRRVWLEMEGRFTDGWGGRLARLRTIIFSDNAQTYLEDIGFRVTLTVRGSSREREWE